VSLKADIQLMHVYCQSSMFVCRSSHSITGWWWCHCKAVSVMLLSVRFV